MSDDFKPSNIIFPLKVTKQEREVIKQLGDMEGGESNAIRHAIRLLLEARGLAIPDSLFIDRKAGNRLPKKEDRQEKLENPLTASTTIKGYPPLIAVS